MELCDLMKHYGLAERHCSKAVNGTHLESISRSHCEHWRKLPAHLELETIVVKDIDRAGQGDEATKRHDFFSKWNEMKGSGATYKQLIAALLKIGCAQDAEAVCKMLKESLLPEQQQVSRASGKEVAMQEPDGACAMASLDEDTQEDLKMQLDQELQSIIRRYNSYISRIRKCLEAKGVHHRDLCFELLSLSAFNHTDQKQLLLSTHKPELERAVDLYDIFNLLVTQYASFLNYDVFQFLVDKYDLDNGQEEFKYPEHLEAYINRHKIAEFTEINPLLKDFTDASKKLILKIDIESTSELGKLKRLKSAVAKVLGLKTAALRLLDIKDGCIMASFLIPTPVAEVIFSKHTTFTDKQVEMFKSLSIVWMECNDCYFDFTAKMFKDTDQKEIDRPQVEEEVAHHICRQYHFINEPDDDLKCVICLDVARDPLQHVECGKLFCKQCLDRHGKDRPCPNCRTEGSMYYPDKKSKRNIQELPVLCSNKDKGCKWEGTVETLEKHMATCTSLRKDSKYSNYLRLECVESPSLSPPPLPPKPLPRSPSPLLPPKPQQLAAPLPLPPKVHLHSAREFGLTHLDLPHNERGNWMSYLVK